MRRVEGRLPPSARSIGTRYLTVVREEVARTVSDPAEIEGEIGALCDGLIADEGRLKP